MTEIRVTYNARDVDEISLAIIVQAKFLGRKGRALVVLAFVLPIVIGMIAFHHFTSLNMWSPEVPALIFLLYVGIICWGFAVAHNAKRLRQVNDRAWYRNSDITWVLTPQGAVQNDGPVWPWSGLTDIHHFKNATILDFAVRRIAVLPDQALPVGQTPEAIQAQITEWKSTCQ